MIGKEELVIDASDFVKGMSTGDDVSDSGFSNATEAVNLIANPGVLYAPATAVNGDSDARITGGLVASSPDMALVGADNRLLVGGNDTYYRYNGTKITAAAYTGGTASTTASGFTDIITYRGEAYVTTKERIKRWENNNTISDFTAAVFVSANVPHPALVYENNAYYADGNLLLQQTAVNVYPTTILTLDVNQVIMALGVDAGTGLMLISTISTLDTSVTLPTTSRLLWYDGNSTKVAKSVPVGEPILGFYSLGGITFVGYGKNLGYINGAGVAFLRRLKNVTNVQAELPYKHHFTSIDSTLYVLDGTQVLAYGEVLPGRKVFYYCFKNPVNSNKPTMIANVGGTSTKLGMAFATNKFYTLDTFSVATIDTLLFQTNNYMFPRPVYLRSAYVEYADAVTNNDDNRILLYRSQERVEGLVTLNAQGGLRLKNTSGASVYFIDNVIGFSGTNNKVRSVQFRYTASAVNLGLKRIIVFYDPAE